MEHQTSVSPPVGTQDVANDAPAIAEVQTNSQAFSNNQPAQNTSNQPVSNIVYGANSTEGAAINVGTPNYSDTADSLTPKPGENDLPLPVVKVLSVRGVEFAMMTLALWFAAGSLLFILIALINGKASFGLLSFPSSMLITSMPIFALLYLRLRRSELEDPRLRFDPSKRRWSQMTQILAFLTCVFNIVGFIYTVLRSIGGEEGANILKSLGTLVVVLLIAGGVLAYYWFDEHRLTKGQ